MLDISDAWGAYQFDLVVANFGLWVEGKLSLRDDKGKPKHTLEKLLADESKQPEMYGSLAGRVTRKVTIPESGVWEDAS